MDSNTTSYKQIDDRGRNDLERIIEELTNENLILKEQKDILEEQGPVFDSMKKKIDALGSTLTTFLKRIKYVNNNKTRMTTSISSEAKKL